MSLPLYIAAVENARRQYFVAPTVFRNGNTPTTYNYYRTWDKAVARYKELVNGSAQVTRADGSYTFPGSGPQTLAINVDFYVPLAGKFYPILYEGMKTNYSEIKNFIARGYLPNGAGPFYFIPNNSQFAISATGIQTTPDKIAELDAWYREMARLKYTYNALAAFLNEMSRRQLSPAEQQIFNEGILRLQNLGAAMRSIKGAEFIYNESGRVGIAPILLLAIVAITAGAVAWTVTEIATEREKTRRINESYEITRWLTAKKAEVAAMAEAGQISQEDKRRIFAGIDASLGAAQDVARQTAKPDQGIFDNLANIVKWGVLGLLGYSIIQTIGKKNERAAI